VVAIVLAFVCEGRVGCSRTQQPAPALPTRCAVRLASGCGLSVIGVENAGEEPLADVVVDEHRTFVAGAGLGEHRTEQRVDRAAHTGGKTRILPQESGEQGRARARET
jgi:hypothetical protein